MTNPRETMPLAKIWEEIEAWNAELDAIEEALDQAESRQEMVEERMQKRMSHPTLSPVGVLPPKPSRGKSASQPVSSIDILPERSPSPPPIIPKPEGISKK